MRDKERLLNTLRSGFLFEAEEVLKQDVTTTPVINDGFEITFKGKTYIITAEVAKWRTKNPAHS